MSSDDEIRKFVETYKITFPVGKENGIAGTLGVRGISVTVFLDKNGRVVKRYMGCINSVELYSDIEAIK